jgi:uncharacterized protein
MLTKEEIREALSSQMESLQRLDTGTEREKLREIKIDDSFALVITGVRRCGKSTFLSQILKKQKKGYYMNLEDPRLNGFGLSDFTRSEGVLKEAYGGGVYFFDEVQNVENWEKFIRHLIDEKEKVVITGSNASLLSRELGSKLTGRHLQIEMFPFSFREFLSMKRKSPSQALFEEYLLKGGFPEYLKKDNPAILHELLSDVVMRDIAVRFGIKNTSVLIRICIYLISNVGKEFSYNSIKKAFEVKSVQSVINFISYFENAYLVFTVPRFSYSYKQQQVNPKKIYSIDNGFSSCNSASFSKDRGKMLENAVFLELRRRFKDIFYFKGKGECDFIIKEKGKITQAFQVCYELNEESKDREISGLAEALEEFNIKEGIILTLGQSDELLVKNKKIVVVPAWKWMAED